MIRGGGDPNTVIALKPSAEWARHLGASPLKRMAASWSGSNIGPNRIQGCGARDAPNSRLPSDQSKHASTIGEQSDAIELDTDIPIQGCVKTLERVHADLFCSLFRALRAFRDKK